MYHLHSGCGSSVDSLGASPAPKQTAAVRRVGGRWEGVRARPARPPPPQALVRKGVRRACRISAEGASWARRRWLGPKALAGRDGASAASHRRGAPLPSSSSSSRVCRWSIRSTMPPQLSITMLRSCVARGGGGGEVGRTDASGLEPLQPPSNRARGQGGRGEGGLGTPPCYSQSAPRRCPRGSCSRSPASPCAGSAQLPIAAAGAGAQGVGEQVRADAAGNRWQGSVLLVAYVQRQAPCAGRGRAP